MTNPVASAFPVACCGVSERMGNIIIPYGSKILRSKLRRTSIKFIDHPQLRHSLGGIEGDFLIDSYDNYAYY